MGTVPVEEFVEGHIEASGASAEQADALRSLNNPLSGSRAGRQNQWYERLGECVELGISTRVIAQVAGKSTAWIERDVLRARVKGYCKQQPSVLEDAPTGNVNGETAETIEPAQAGEPADVEPAPAHSVRPAQSSPMPDAAEEPLPAESATATDVPPPPPDTAIAEVSEENPASDPSGAPESDQQGAGRSMSDEHKEAIALGRTESRAVSRYLDALEAHRPKRGRRMSTEALVERRAAAEAALARGNLMVLKRLELLQEVSDLDEALAQRSDVHDMAALEAGFVAHAASYARRKGIQYKTWREIGVTAEVLERAGMARRA